MSHTELREVIAQAENLYIEKGLKKGRALIIPEKGNEDISSLMQTIMTCLKLEDDLRITRMVFKGENVMVILVSSDKDEAVRLAGWAAEMVEGASVESTTAALAEFLGRWCGVPECCNKKYLESIRAKKVGFGVFFSEQAMRCDGWGEPFAFEVRYGWMKRKKDILFPYIWHIPCSPDCEASRLMLLERKLAFIEHFGHDFPCLVRQRFGKKVRLKTVI
jgi:hypothetical protein